MRFSRIILSPLSLPKEPLRARLDKHSDLERSPLTVMAVVSDLHRVSLTSKTPSGSAPDKDALRL